MSKTALITGISGQDGYYLARLLLQDGYRVIGLTRPAASDAGVAAVPGVLLEASDLLDLASWIRVLEKTEPHEIYNLAGLSHVPACQKEPLLAAQVNGGAVIRILEAVRRVNPKIRFFQASSSQMYGAGPAGLLDEGAAIRPANCYGVSKAFGHCAAVAYRQAYQLFVCCGILFNHESPRRRPEFVTRKITLAAARIAKGMQQELRLGNSKAVRDWGFAGDYVRAMRMMLAQDEPADYVIGTGKLHSVEDFAREAFSRAGLDWRDWVRTNPELVRPREPVSLAANPGRAQRRLGWRPETSFQEMVSMMVQADLSATEAPGDSS